MWYTTLLLLFANWPQWRGPGADGISPEKGLPVEWEKSIRWKTPLAGLGTSVPIVWEDRIFLTTQVGDGPFEQRGRDFDNASVAKKTGQGKVEFRVLAFARKDGKLLWSHSIPASDKLQPVHLKHNLASPSIVTDGRTIYAWFGTGQVAALTMDGKHVWSRDLGPFDILWGHGSSPLLYRDSLILLCDHQGAAYILSVDKTTGKDQWRVDRGKDRRSYSTPFLIPGALIVNSSARIDAFNPDNGEMLWFTGEDNRVPVPTPIFHGGVLYASRGFNSGPYFAQQPGGKVLWEVKTGAPYVSSLLYYNGLLYMAAETGIVTCVDAADGKPLWKERFGGVFSASPVAADGKIYLINESGEFWVLAAGREKKIVHNASLGERTLASPSISNGMIFVRTDENLIAIGR